MNVSAPVILGFFGLGTGYLIYGPQEILGFRGGTAATARGTGVWGIWMPGFCQLLTGTYIFVALVWFKTLNDPALYTAGLAFSAYGIHWFALGWNRMQGNDPRTTGYMSIPFIVISVLGLYVFFKVGLWAVGVLFIGLTVIYICEFFAGFRVGVREPGPEGTGGLNPGERALGVAHIITGIWLMYLTFATTLNISLHYTLPAG